jgi:hypothetical protein
VPAAYFPLFNFQRLGEVLHLSRVERNVIAIRNQDKRLTLGALRAQVADAVDWLPAMAKCSAEPLGDNLRRQDRSRFFSRITDPLHSTNRREDCSGAMKGDF